MTPAPDSRWHLDGKRERDAVDLSRARRHFWRATGETSNGASVSADQETNAKSPGVFEGCLRTKETSPLEPLVKEYKVYAPGIGLVKDGSLALVSHGSASR